MCRITVLIYSACIAAASALTGPFTQDFVRFLASNDDYSGLTSLEYGMNGSFGGKLFSNQKVREEPVIFIHGNSDGALDNGNGLFSAGWTLPIEYFLKKGYTSAELYALTWGDRNLANAGLRQHSCAHLQRIRRFIAAVMDYSGADKVDVIAHSMGVTLARQAVKGGSVYLGNEDYCSLGQPLNARIDTFLGIAGANRGLCSCTNEIAQIVPACSLKFGFWPGDACASDSAVTCQTATEYDECGERRDYSFFLKRLNEDDTREADVIMSMWSAGDEIIGNGGLVWGVPTGLIPDSYATLVFEDLKHEDVKSLTGRQQLSAVTKHSFA